LFQPVFGEFARPALYSISKFLGSTVPGTTPQSAMAWVVAVVIQSGAAQELTPGESAFVCLHEACAEF